MRTRRIERLLGYAAIVVAACGLVAATDVRAQAADRKPAAPTKRQASRQAVPKPKSAGATVPTIPSTGDPQKDQAAQSAERDRLTSRIAALRRQIAAGEKSRSGAAAALARAEHALVDVNRRLDELAQRQRATQELATALDRQRTGTEGQIAVGQADLARTMMRLSANQDRDPLRTWIAGGNPNDGMLADGLWRDVVRAEAADLDALHIRANDLQARRQKADDESRALGLQADAQKSAREALASDQASQRQALERLSQQLAEQRNTASALEADEKRLSRVVEQLQRVIEQKAADERARRLAARRLADQQAAAAAAQKNRGSANPAPPPKVREAPPPAAEPDVDEVSGNAPFARLRGQLRLPARGTVTGRFGMSRGGGSSTWKGLFVRTEAGAEVRAVAPGKVIYADDLRGFGNLLIVDHGNQYLSIYANNDVLLKRAGDPVQAGDVVSRAGNSSGDDQTGLYFELRFRGKPFDPTPWIAGR